MKRVRLLASTCTSLLQLRKPVQRNYWDFFKDLKSKNAFLINAFLIKLRLLVKKFSNGNYFEIEGNHESRNIKTLFWWYFFRFVTRAIILRPQKSNIYVFGESLVFASFMPFSVGFRR